ncbi:UDP-N-acetylglucosamine transporter ROCK1-like isoform X2 [Magnolia sinica]|uniref:UDP-N-acetylglucosamine transporter ROCK1-like isoform X2 n=1 Tax=Magnolia sinica TaxID=86752 RepID=UPI00265AB506|nr:UDP-N-acetylglucosamine transporter ROCK1-like isoform X2 [Magnolia sinica]
MGALFLLIIAAILLSFGEGSGRDSGGTNLDQVLFHGIIPVLVASVLSGKETQLMLNDCGNVYSWKPVSGLLLSVSGLLK